MIANALVERSFSRPELRRSPCCELLESELFGHAKGAFTSAVTAKQGLLEVADHGTVFLDEIGDIDLQVQPKLLKVLEDRIFRRVGDVHDKAVDIRLISATHSELLDLVQQQRFREDLYYRVDTVPLRVPPLRERTEDIPMLVQHFLSRLSQDCGRGEFATDQSAMDSFAAVFLARQHSRTAQCAGTRRADCGARSTEYAAPSIPVLFTPGRRRSAALPAL